MRTEPARIIGAVQALLVALVALAAYVWQWEPELVAIVGAITAAVIGLLTAVFVRAKVTPTATLPPPPPTPYDQAA